MLLSFGLLFVEEKKVMVDIGASPLGLAEAAGIKGQDEDLEHGGSGRCD